jgi:hypothetical protein
MSACEYCGSKTHATNACNVPTPPLEPERVIQLAVMPDSPHVNPSVYALTNRGRIFVWSADSPAGMLHGGPDLST